MVNPDHLKQALKRNTLMDSEVCFDFFVWKYGRGRNIQLARTSDDEDLASYLDHMGSNGSTYMDTDGSIIISIHDIGGATPATWYEEIAHAKQFLERGQFSAGIDGTIAECETEVAKCLLKNAEKLALTDSEILLAEKSLKHYSRDTNNA